MTESEIKTSIEEIFKILDAHDKNQSALQNQTFNEQQILRNALNLTEDKIAFEPFYYRHIPIDSQYPKIFNSRGERMHFCFIRDKSFANNPHGGRKRFIIWDRFNFGLKVHAYTMEEIFKPVGNPKHKFAMLNESRKVKPQVYDEVLKRKDWIAQNFDFIFTFDTEILKKVSNAKFSPLQAGCDFDLKFGGGGQSDDIYNRKTKLIANISTTSIKNLAESRYAIVIEDEISPIYFTSKITNCFAMQTVPIYLGATDIGRFFNVNGIIQIQPESLDHIEKILENCNVEDYQRRLPAILDNFGRVQNFKSPIDSLYPIYLWKFFEED